MTWRQFGVYLDAFTWLCREETEEGRQANRKDDLRAKSLIPSLKEAKRKLLEETKAEVAKHKQFALTNPQGGTTVKLLDVN